MLQSAHLAKDNGIDVVAGYIEPHTRPETMALLEGLEVMQPLKIPYRGIELREFDLDSAILRRPGLILVDELAYSNAPVCRHVKVPGYPGIVEGGHRCLYDSKCTTSGKPHRHCGIHYRSPCPGKDSRFYL